MDVSRDGTFLVFSNTDFSHPAELFRLNLAAAAGSATPLTRINAEALQDIEFGEASSFTFRGWNGEDIQAWRVTPPGFDASKKYPLLLLMHGGPENSWTNLFHYRWNAQLFAAPGYVAALRGDYAQLSRLVGLRSQVHGRNQGPVGRGAV